MTTLSDQIDTFTRHTRSIKASASKISDNIGLFTRAVLNTHLGDLIRDIDPSELGLFTLAEPAHPKGYEKNAHVTQPPEIKRTEFTGATPLRKNTHRREDKQVIEPEVYAHAALKYIEQYQPIRPMPRAYDQIVSILNRLKDIRRRIDAFNSDLNKQPQETVPKEPLSSKVQIEQEEQRIRDLQLRIAELHKQKESAQKRRTQFLKPSRLPEKKPPPPTSPQEDNFWNTPVGPSRTLRFTENDNLMDEQVNLGDISASSFGTPTVRLADIRGPKDITLQPEDEPEEENPAATEVNSELGASSSVSENYLSDKEPEYVKPASPPKKSETSTRTGGSKKIRVNLELERIVTKIISNMGSILLPEHRNTQGSPPVAEIVAHLQHLAFRSPQPDSPSTSAASTISSDITARPSVQDILTAHLFTTLISATPNHSMPLSKVKEEVQLKIKSCGGSAAGQTNTRILYGCVAKRLLKIDRGGGEQIVRFDI